MGKDLAYEFQFKLLRLILVTPSQHLNAMRFNVWSAALPDSPMNRLFESDLFHDSVEPTQKDSTKCKRIFSF